MVKAYRAVVAPVWLSDLVIRNLAIIDEVEVALQPGFNVLTGETGAGKSIIVQALAFLFGDRGDTDLIRGGEECLSVSARFRIENPSRLRNIFNEIGIEGEGDLILQRELWINGRSRCRINGQMATVSQLKQIGKLLIDIHGQHSHQSLLDVSTHLTFVETFAGDAIAVVKEEYQSHYVKWRDVEKELKDLREKESDRARMEDLLRFQIQEIESARLEKDEEERLARERQILIHSERLSQSLNQAGEALGETGGALDSLGIAINAVQRASEVDPQLKPLEELLTQSFDLAQEVALQISRYRSGTEFDPQRLEEVEARLDLIGRLKKKYGPDIPSILAYADVLRQELEKLETRQERIERLEKERRRLRQEISRLAQALSAERQQASRQLERAVQKQLRPLAMEKARLKVAISWDGGEDGLEVDGRKVAFGPEGIDRVEFLFSANAGEPFKPLSRIASGGELSRMMLALKVCLQDRQQIPILVFDEIDVGISGRAGEAVGEKLREIGQFAQVLCVTHLPQIASQADWHLVVDKIESGGRTRVTVRALAERERVNELARLMSGRQITAGSLSHAREMLEKARSRKGPLD